MIKNEEENKNQSGPNRQNGLRGGSRMNGQQGNNGGQILSANGLILEE